MFPAEVRVSRRSASPKNLEYLWAFGDADPVHKLYPPICIWDADTLIMPNRRRGPADSANQRTAGDADLCSALIGWEYASAIFYIFKVCKVIIYQILHHNGYSVCDICVYLMNLVYTALNITVYRRVLAGGGNMSFPGEWLRRRGPPGVRVSFKIVKIYMCRRQSAPAPSEQQ